MSKKALHVKWEWRHDINSDDLASTVYFTNFALIVDYLFKNNIHI